MVGQAHFTNGQGHNITNSLLTPSKSTFPDFSGNPEKATPAHAMLGCVKKENDFSVSKGA